jgi:nucleoside-diphosphate-sugar epimerase
MQTSFHDPINLGNPHEITVRELAAIILRLTGSTSRIESHPDRRGKTDPQQRRPDIARARAQLGWEPRVDLEEGLRRTIEDFRRRL